MSKAGIKKLHMKKIIIVGIMLLGLSIFKANAQFVRAKPAFSIGVSVGAPGPAPYGGAIWVGPEYAWRGGTYVVVPGHWDRGRGSWHSGSWVPKRNGYHWKKGHW